LLDAFGVGELGVADAFHASALMVLFTADEDELVDEV
jgi:hypothetical protein